VTNGDERVDDAGHAPGKASLAYFNTFWTPLFGSLSVSTRRRPGAEKFDKKLGMINDVGRPYHAPAMNP
jgi:hypothetical protein